MMRLSCFSNTTFIIMLLTKFWCTSATVEDTTGSSVRVHRLLEVRGHLDSVIATSENYLASGWTCVVGSSASIDVHIYAGGAAGVGTFAAAGTANIPNEDAVGDACGGSDGNHRFSITIPFDEADIGQGVFIHAIAGTNPLISNNSAAGQHTFPDLPEIRGHLDSVIATSENYLASGWTCVVGSSASIDVHIYAGGAAGVGTFAAAGTANIPNEDAVGDACGGSDGNHRFSITIPFDEADPGQGVFIHAIAGTNPLISNNSAAGQHVIPPGLVVERRLCYDNPQGWYDSDGPVYNCQWYSKNNNCNRYGNGYKNMNKVANEACCVCGGGGGDGCHGYFCDKYIHTMFILMTHNSFAVAGAVSSPNQNYGVGTQFKDGIRGFNFDIYWEDGRIIMKHGPSGWSDVDYSTSVAEIVKEMDKLENRHEFVLIQFEDNVGNDNDNTRIDKVLEPWGDKVITNFRVDQKLGDYIIAGKRVLLTSHYGSESKGIHNYEDLITENNYQWYSALENVDFGYRRGPDNSYTSMKMMNHFCGTWPGAGSMVSSAIANGPDRILYDARMFKKLDYAKDNINIMMIDYYETGNVWEAQEKIRGGDLYSDCWGDGSLCGIGSTCFSCCNKNEYWYSKAMTACGEEPCWGDGTICGSGTTCNACCNSYEFWDSKFITACGKEPCWGSGTVCGAGTTCNNCCSGNGGAHCPWYQFGICTCG